MIEWENDRSSTVSEENDIFHEYAWGIQNPKKGIYNKYTRHARCCCQNSKGDIPPQLAQALI